MVNAESIHFSQERFGAKMVIMTVVVRVDDHAYDCNTGWFWRQGVVWYDRCNKRARLIEE
jgi:hypothetical protein